MYCDIIIHTYNFPWWCEEGQHMPMHWPTFQGTCITKVEPISVGVPYTDIQWILKTMDNKICGFQSTPELNRYGPQKDVLEGHFQLLAENLLH